MINHWEIFLSIIGSIIVIWYSLREANGQFDAGEINKSDQELYEDSENFGIEIAAAKECLENIEKSFKK